MDGSFDPFDPFAPLDRLRAFRKPGTLRKGMMFFSGLISMRPVVGAAGGKVKRDVEEGIFTAKGAKAAKEGKGGQHYQG